MNADGSLVDRDFPSLVQAIHEGHATGLLTLTSAGVGKSVTVQEGRLVFASSTSTDDRLGELLLRRGKITLRQYHDAGRAIGPGKRLGTVLVELGVLSPKDLVKAVIEQTQEIIYSLFLWREGHYRLQAGAPEGEAITLKISTPDVIIEGIRRIEDWSRIERGVGGASAQYQRADDYENVLRNMSLSFEKLSLLTDMNGVATVEALCEDSTLPDFEVCRTLWAFRVIGVVRRVGGPEERKTIIEDDGLDSVLIESDGDRDSR